MAQARKDDNNVSTLLGTLNTDGVTPTNVRVNAATNALSVLNGGGGSDLSGDEADRDDNNVPVILGTSSTDGTTPVAIYVNSSGQILIDTA